MNPPSVQPLSRHSPLPTLSIPLSTLLQPFMLPVRKLQGWGGVPSPAGSQSLISGIRIKKVRERKEMERGGQGKSEKHVGVQLSGIICYCPK